MLSDGFSEGQTRDINEGFPSDSFLYTDHFDYLSDSDLEDEDLPEDSEQELPQDSASAVPPATASACPPLPSQDTSEIESRHTSALNSVDLFNLPR